MRPPSQLLRLAPPALATYGWKGLNALAAFAATAMLARAAGPAVVGNYGFAVITSNLLSVFVLRGLDQISLRQIAGDLRVGNQAAASGTLRYTLRAVAIAVPLMTFAFIMAIVAGPVAEWLQVDQGALIATSIGIGSASFYRLGLCVIRGLGHPVAGQFFEGLNSLIFAGLIAGLLLAGAGISAAAAVLLFFACQIASLLLLWQQIRRKTRSWPSPAPVDASALTAASMPIMGTQAMHSFSEWLLLALIATATSSADLGAMRVAMQVILIIAMVVMTGENYLAAYVASDMRAGRIDSIWARHRRATLAMAAILTPFIGACIFWPASLLTLAFGPAFAVAGPALAIMAAGQATKIITGPIGGLLAMAGLERQLLWISIVSLVLIGTMAWVLIPLWGITGAACAHALAIAWRNIASYTVARRNLLANASSKHQS